MKRITRDLSALAVIVVAACLRQFAGAKAVSYVLIVGVFTAGVAIDVVLARRKGRREMGETDE